MWNCTRSHRRVTHRLRRARANVCYCARSARCASKVCASTCSGRGSCNCGAPESALEEDVQNPLDLLHTQRLAQKAVLRLNVRLGRPRRKLRFLPAASKDLDGQQVCTIGDHAEGAAPVLSTIEQQHEGLSENRPPCAHGSRTVRPTSHGLGARKCPEGASPTCCRR